MKDNRDKRKAVQERRNFLAKQMQAIDAAMHAESWEWKEVAAKPVAKAA
jgi:hypothetical protein